MPGHNHYPWCGCGWCVKLGSRHYRPFTAAEITEFTDVYSARRFLERHNVGRTIAACFVNPNATCPVCNASVFYYQNAHGSRVYFDDLGPPWPKHPCTDNDADRRSAGMGTVEKPAKRARGIRLDLLEAARTVYWSGGIAKPSEEIGAPWEIWTVKEISRSRHRNTVVADPICEDDKDQICFAFDSAHEVIEVSDLIFLKANEISVFDVQKMKTKRYKITMIHCGDHSGSAEG